MSRRSAYSPYKRRRPALLRNLWVYRRMVLLAVLLGVLLWFIVINNTPVTVYLPFGLGSFATRSGIAILMGALAGGAAAALGITLVWALRRQRLRHPGTDPQFSSGTPDGPTSKPAGFDDELPPADYAARTKEGFPNDQWPAR